MKLKLLLIIIAAAFLCMMGFLTFLTDRALFWRSERDVLVAQASATLPSVVNGHKVVLVGDSIFANFPMKAFFPQTLTVTNKGVARDSIRQISERYKNEMDRTPHDVVVLEGGINDILGCILENKNIEAVSGSIVKMYRETVASAKDKGKKVVICSILPVTHKFLLPYSKAIALPTEFDVHRTNEMIRSVNKKLKSMADEESVAFCDLHSSVVDKKGQFRRSMASADGYHVNVSGYKVPFRHPPAFSVTPPAEGDVKWVGNV